MKIRSIMTGMLFVGIIGSSMLSIAEEPAKDGKTVFLAQKCDMCHSVTSQELASKKKTGAFDLSTIGDKANAETLTKYMKKEVELNGKKHAMAWKGSDEDLKILVTWFETLKEVKEEKK